MLELTEVERADRARVHFARVVAGYALSVAEREVSDRSVRSGPALLARHVAMYLAHVALEMSLARIAAALGQDRSTVAHACHRIEDRRDEAAFDAWISALEETVRAAPEPRVMPDVGRAA